MQKICQPPLIMNLYSNLLHKVKVHNGLMQMSFNQITDQQFSNCDGFLLAKLTNKISIAVDPNDYNGRIVYLFGTNEPRIQAVIQALLSPGDRFLDIGANYSSIGLSAINSVGSNGQIHLFEPQPEICQSVEKAIQTARLTNVFLHKVALMNYSSDKQLIRPKKHSGKGTLLAEYGDQEEWETVTVSVKNIQDYVPPLVDLAPFGAKVDVEGAEIYVIPWLLSQPNLKFLVFEVARNLNNLWDIVKSSGLVLYGIKGQLFTTCIHKIESLNDLHLYRDVLAVKLNNSVKLPQKTSPYNLGKLLKIT